MPQPRNHYDNLKIARNAPLEVIEAAYRALVQKYRPDRNPIPSATRVMRIINAAYDVLSDPVKRREHDEWIANTECRASSKAEGAIRVRLTTAARALASAALRRSRNIAAGLAKRRMPIALLALAIAVALIQLKSPNASVGLSSTANLTPADTSALKPNYVLNAPIEAHVPNLPVQFAPNGKPWPAGSGYVPGGPKHRVTGSSTVTIDNTAGSFDAFVKLVFNPDGQKPRSVSWVIVKAGDPFTVTGLRPGRYATYYQDLVSGEMDKSPTFQLHEDSTGYSTERITLYTLVGGNIQMQTVGSREFNGVDSDADFASNAP